VGRIIEIRRRSSSNSIANRSSRRWIEHGAERVVANALLDDSDFVAEVLFDFRQYRAQRVARFGGRPSECVARFSELGLHIGSPLRQVFAGRDLEQIPDLVDGSLRFTRSGFECALFRAAAVFHARLLLPTADTAVPTKPRSS